nr:hypothetical protein [Tanacetum cinerariifolium]
PCRALTVRKSVRTLPSYCLALRYISHHLDHFTFGSSSEDSVDEDIDMDVLEDVEADAMAVEVVVDRDVEAGVASLERSNARLSGTMMMERARADRF